MSIQKHIIKNQVLELGLPSPSTAYQIQDTVSRIYREKVIPIIDSCCSEVGTSDSVHRFDSLCIDVGRIPVNDLEKELPARTEARLRGLLKETISHPGSEDGSVGGQAKGVDVIPAQVSRRDIFEHFINTGTLPWWVSGTDTGEIEAILKRVATESPDELAKIITRNARDSTKLKRLVYQFSDDALQLVSKALLRPFSANVRQFCIAFAEAFLAADVRLKHSKSEIRLSLWSKVFYTITNTSPEKADLARLGRELLIRLSERLGTTYRELAGAVMETAEKMGGNRLYLRKVIPVLISDVSFSGKNAPQANEQVANKQELDNLLTRIKERLRAQRKAQGTELKDIESSLESAMETLLSLAEAGALNTLPTIDRAKRKLNKSADSGEKVRERRPSIERLFQEMKNIIKELSGEAISPEKQERLKKVIKELHSLQSRVVSAEKISLLRHLETLLSELQNKNILKNKKYPIQDKSKEKSTNKSYLTKSQKYSTKAKLKKEPSKKPGEITTIKPEGDVSQERSDDFTSKDASPLENERVTLPPDGKQSAATHGLHGENLVREIDSLLAALQRDFHFAETSQRRERQLLGDKKTGARKKQFPGIEREKRLLNQYKQISGLLEQLLSLPYLAKEVVTKLTAIIHSLSGKETPGQENRLQQLLDELRAVLRTARTSINKRKVTQEREQESPAGISEYAPAKRQPKGKKTTGKAGTLRSKDTGTANTGEPRAKAADASAGSGPHHNELTGKLRESQGQEEIKTTTPDIRHLESESLKSTRVNIEGTGGVNQATHSDRETEAGQTVSSDRDALEPSDEMYIKNAGLVILWPFLNRFFESVGLVKEGLFVSPAASERAVHLLQYLVNGSPEAPEYELPLNKVLCGISLAEPVARDFEISEEESCEAEGLIQAVIQNWPALGNISTEGFQAAFLQRQGILTRRNGNWLVQVERQTHDILLDKLDWTISVIRLPWLHNIIYTEW